MNPEQHQKPDPYAELKAAYAAKKIIQLLDKGYWYDLHKPSFSFSVDSYRIKPDCTYLGSVTVLTKKIDFYFHLAEGKPPDEASLIYRTGDECSDYGWTPVKYVTPLSLEHVIALGLYIKHLGADGANGYVRGRFYKDGKTVLDLQPEP
jgi:hypothetical protein